MNKQASVFGEWRHAVAELDPNEPMLGLTANDIHEFLDGIDEAIARAEAAESALADERMQHDILKELLSAPEVQEFYEGILREVGHQRQRWGSAHDRSKSAENWYWLVGYLAGKALRSAISGDKNKALHHCISSAAALFQWHQAILADESGRGVGNDADLKAKETA